MTTIMENGLNGKTNFNGKWVVYKSDNFEKVLQAAGKYM